MGRALRLLKTKLLQRQEHEATAQRNQMAVDATRAAGLRQLDYETIATTIPENITRMNPLLLAQRPR